EAFINNQKSSGRHVDSFDFSLSCFRFIESVAEDLLDHIIALLQTLQKTCFDNKSEFLELLFEDSVNDLSNSGTSSIPRTITLPKYYQMINGLFDKLSLSITKWKVFFEIGDLDLDGKSINANEVTLYDARKWHKGERFEWDMRADLVDEKGTKMRSRFREYAYGNFKSFGSNDLRKINFRRNSARAMIKVSAYDASMAASEARKLLNKSLNMMVYEFTNEARLKHHPQITRSNEVVSDDDKISHYEINSDPSDILKISQREQEILESYERPALISRGDRLYRALSWFNAAFWESDNYAKYVLYWIGFEQLLDLRSEATRESTKEKLVRIIPSITVTWRNDAHANYVIYSHLQEIVRALSSMSQITSKMESDTRFKDWKVKDFIILENLPLLKQLVNNTSIEQSVRMLESWINENKLGIEVRTAFLRKKSEFEIAYLYARRNTLIHEGLTLAGDLDYFVNLLRKLLTKVISVTLSFPSEQDWDSISKEYNRPFSASFNLDDPPPL
ncbi:MAG: hypothetical protein WB587_07730, partial [Nitrososphaeraceae archaeon]